MKRHVRYLAVFSAALWMITSAGAFFPGPLTWGFHFLSYFALPVRIACSLAGFAGIFLLTREKVLLRAEALLGSISAKPIPLLVGTIAAFFAAAIALRVDVPLLGDSFIAIKLYENRAGGSPFLPNSHYPIAFFYFFNIMRWLGAYSFPRIMDAFLLGEMILGAGYIAAVWFITRTLFDDARMRTVSFFMLVLLPATQIFLGYVEIYAVSLFFLSLYLLGALLYLKKKIPFSVLPSIYLFLVLSHYLNFLLLPSLLYLAYAAYRRDGVNALGTGFAAAAAVALTLYSLSGIDPATLIPAPRHSPILSVGGLEDLYQAYTLFSPYHGIDLLNLLLLLSPAGVFLIVLGLQKERFLKSPAALFFSLALVPVVLFAVVAKFDLPMAQDWDIPAPYALIVTLLGLLLAGERFAENGARSFLVLLLVTAVNSFTWFSLNATTQPAIERAQSFVDKRISSQDGSFQSTLHFVEYYLTRKDTAEVARAFERFLSMYPTDRRGYANYTLHLMQFGNQADQKIRGIFERWRRLDPASTEAEEHFADFLLDVGHRKYNEGAVIDAAGHFEEAIVLNPSLAEAYNGLGVIYRRSGDLDRAITFYEKAAALDSVSVYAFINLGNLYDDRGVPERAIAYYRKAIRLAPNAAEAYFNLGITYERTGATAQSLDAIRQAARLGMNDAQHYLRTKGEQW